MPDKAKDTVEVENAINPFGRKGYLVPTSVKMTADIGRTAETAFPAGNLKDESAAKRYGNPGGYPGLAGLKLKDGY
jgi:hypothetical protein